MELVEQIKRLPDKLTKEQLMNWCVHEADLSYRVQNKMSVLDLIEIAKKHGKQIKGNSKLEVNVSKADQEELEKEHVRKVTKKNKSKEDKELIRAGMLENKSKIIKMYNSGLTLRKIGKEFDCSAVTIRTYLAEFNIQIRPRGIPKNKETQETKEVAKKRATGVYFRSDNGKWRAIVRTRGKNIYLGCYAKKEEAEKIVNEYWMQKRGRTSE